MKNDLKKKVWSKKDYYQKAHAGSLDTKHYGMVLLKEVSTNAESILDLGCGDGTRLNYLTNPKTEGTGVDVSDMAISFSKKTYPNLNFLNADLEKLPFQNNKFDLTYSAYVLEHLDNPEKVLNEAIRVTKQGGNIILIAPNYGSPNRSSPVFKGSRILKLISGFYKDLLHPVLKVERLGWNKVEPKIDSYEQDSDTTVEPYLGSLLLYLKQNNLRVKVWSSCWEEEMPNPKLFQKVIKFLAKLKIYPFIYWGPHIVVQLNKSK